MVKDVLLICKNCGNEFLTDKTHTYQKYCGWRCRGDYFKKNNPEKVKIYKKRERIKNFQNYQKINAIYKDRTRFGGNRRKIMERDLFSCLNCGSRYPYFNLIVHHIDENKTNNKLDNLVTLCRACHALIHHH
jgi:5-methylcytosine-specific restriction endonuclease McrA